MIKSALRSLIYRFGYEVTRRAGARVCDPFKAQEWLLKGLGVQYPIIFDIGAYHGDIAYRYRSLFPTARIFCFEPYPQSAGVLSKRFEHDKSAQIINKAVADTSGQRTLHVNRFDPTHSLLPRPTASRRYYPSLAGPERAIEVETVSIDDFVAAEHIKDVSILKLDIQGSELLALQGASKLLRQASVPLIYTEVMFVPHYEKGVLFHELWSFLDRYQYTLFDIYDLHRGNNGQLRYGDALFVSPLARTKVIDTSHEEP